MSPSVRRILLAAVVGFVVLAGACGIGMALTRGAWWPTASVLVAAFEEPEFAELPDEEAVLRYLIAHRDQVSLVVLDAEGDVVLAHQPDRTHVLASTMKVVVGSALARARSEGVLGPPPTTRAWESWYLPGTDGGAHPRAYDRLGIEHVDGIATRDEPVSWEQVLSAMLHESDNAATDLVLEELGDRIDRETHSLDEPKIEPILPIFLELSDVVSSSFSSPSDRAKAIEAGGTMKASFSEQRAFFHDRMPRGTALRYAQRMHDVGSRTFVDEDTSEWLATALEWPMEHEGNRKRFEHFGAKGGSVPGVITEAMYVVPKDGPHRGEVLAGALFMNDLSGSAWLGLMSSFAQQGFLVRVMTDDGFRERVEEGLR